MYRTFLTFLVAFLTVLPAQTAFAATEPEFATQNQAVALFSSTLSHVATGTTIRLDVTAQVTTTTPTRLPVRVPTTSVTPTLEVTRLRTITVQPVVTATTAVSTARSITTETPLPTPTPDPAATDAAYAGAIAGTVVANRTDVAVRFFVEGATYDLAGLRSLGLDLPRVTAVLNLYNCAADVAESENCFWDPYPLTKDGFYEIINGIDDGKTVSLSLRQAGAPPGDRIWVQNRVGGRETIFYNDTVYELPPSAVQEFTTQPDAPILLLYLRRCLNADNKSVCEWTPRDVKPGYYYALVETSAPAGSDNTTTTELALDPILAPIEAEVTPDALTTLTNTVSLTRTAEITNPAEPAARAGDTVVCQVQVPTLNVRSGPGLQYRIIGKVLSSEQAPGTVTVIGRDETGQWVAVDAQITSGGWITASPGFLQCDGDVAALAVGQITDGRLEATPEAAVVVAPADEVADVNTSGDTTAVQPGETVTSTTPSAPPPVAIGQSLLLVNNGFDQPIRFTLDQRYRIELGPSEFDLQPGQSINVLVYPGQIAFSASSPWRQLAGNAEFFLDSQQSRLM
ncbi:MAG: SH3 domain-containing protein, partial [Chloroflexota bacterium]|nr:SH3 domain-containing protein [Chloroflexota bacterium]